MGEGRGPVEILITNYSCVPCGRCVCTPVASRSARLSPCDLSRVRKLGWLRKEELAETRTRAGC